ncbi:hypothetical protein BU16DRAFT_557406 [Lophium mytilinum]|uniref:Uncharacterized protein n=1 Tax=Lophium mytilinum TaxID=390894 RepID=A0A6A6R5Q1_9PEZI|nr:hypothetical protein BU16DRAFT_557406 [Lophium mytilinum]
MSLPEPRDESVDGGDGRRDWRVGAGTRATRQLQRPREKTTEGRAQGEHLLRSAKPMADLRPEKNLRTDDTGGGEEVAVDSVQKHGRDGQTRQQIHAQGAVTGPTCRSDTNREHYYLHVEMRQTAQSVGKRQRDPLTSTCGEYGQWAWAS